MKKKVFTALILGLLMLGGAGAAEAGSVFLTGHDADFHAAYYYGNQAGARNIIRSAINFIRDPDYNTMVTRTSRVLFVDSNTPPPSGHIDSVLGMAYSGYIQGYHYDVYDYHNLNAGLNLLGTTYDSIVIASDFGGTLTQAELNILNSRKSDIISFLNAGGGLFAMAESNGGAGLTPDSGWYGFLPFVNASRNISTKEWGNILTPYGISLGLTASDINDNYSHNVFNDTYGLTVVDYDSIGNILSLAGRGQILDVTQGVSPVPVPPAVWLFGSGLLGLIGIRRKIQG